MFNKSKTEQKAANRAPITLQPTSVSDQQRKQIEQDLAGFDPTWEGTECHMSMPLDVDPQAQLAQLAQLVSIFPNGEVTMETTSGPIIMSGSGGSQYGTQYGSKPSTPSHRTDDTESLSTRSRAS